MPFVNDDGTIKKEEPKPVDPVTRPTPQPTAPTPPGQVSKEEEVVKTTPPPGASEPSRGSTTTSAVEKAEKDGESKEEE